MSSTRRKILGIGYPKFAIDEWKELDNQYEIHYFQPEGREQVQENIKRLCEEHGPFDAGYVLFNTSRFSPFHEDLLGPLFAKGPKCGVWAQAGVGYDDVDEKWLAKNGCYLSNTPTAVTEATGDMAVILILNTIRGTYETEKEVREGRWKDQIAPTDDPEGKTVGIIGLGAIGKVAARKLKPWDMNVIYYNRNRLPEHEEKELGVTWVPFDELISTSDLVSLNCPLNDNTRGLISKAQIDKMKDGVCIVNTARGGVIDQEALIEGLKSGKIARAGLDVFTPEPLRESWLFSSPKVSLQPHLAAFTKRTFLKGERAVFANVKQFLETGKPLNPCNSPVGK